MARLLPQPAMSAGLFVVWLLAFNRFTPGVALTGVLLAVAIPLGTARFWPEYPRRLRYRPLLGLAGVVFWDVLVANVRVARLVLGPRDRLRSTFFVVPLELAHPMGVAVLVAVVSLAPGTVCADYDPDARELLVHGLDVGDPAAAAAVIKRRYERLLREAFAA